MRIFKFNEAVTDIGPIDKEKIMQIDPNVSKALISSWERSKGNVQFREIEFLRWYEENVNFKPYMIKSIDNKTDGNWNGIKLVDFYDYLIEFVDDYNAEICIFKGHASKDTFLTLWIKGKTEDIQKEFIEGSKNYSKICKMVTSIGEMNGEKISLFRFLQVSGGKNLIDVKFFFTSL